MQKGLVQQSVVTAVVLTCDTCGLVRVSDNPAAAQARARAHTSVTGHSGLLYECIESPERIKLALAFEQRSLKTVRGYVEEGDQDSDDLDNAIGRI
jgi:hypothetical protein